MNFITDISLENKTPISKSKKEEVKDKLENNYKEESVLVKGIFKNLEVPNGELEFSYRKYPQDPLRMYKFQDGKEYEIPLYLARHINNDCNEKGFKYIRNLDGDVLRSPKVYPSRQRYQFLSNDYM